MSEKRVKIIGQTGADMSMEEAEKLNIDLIPEYVLFGTEEFRTRVNISDEDFYRKMSESEKLPTSSHPTVGDYVEHYNLAIENGAEAIVCLTVTSKMSGSYDTAVTAKKFLERRGVHTPIYVYDSEQVSHGMVPLLREAAKCADEGLGVEEIINRLDQLKPRIAVYFMLDTLENAQKGGRVGKIKAAAADFLGLKPILVFANGVCSDFAIATNYSGGVKKLISLVKKEMDTDYPISVFHGEAIEKAMDLKGEIVNLFGDVQMDIGYVGSVIGIYAGRGSVGMAYIRK